MNKLIDTYIKLLINHSTQFNSTQLNSIRQCEKWNLGRENGEKKSIDFQICVVNTIYNTYTPTYTDILHITSNIWIAIQLRLMNYLIEDKSHWFLILLLFFWIVCVVSLYITCIVNSTLPSSRKRQRQRIKLSEFLWNISHSCVIIFILVNLQMTQFTNDSSISSCSSSDSTGIEV